MTAGKKYCILCVAHATYALGLTDRKMRNEAYEKRKEELSIRVATNFPVETEDIKVCRCGVIMLSVNGNRKSLID